MIVDSVACVLQRQWYESRAFKTYALDLERKSVLWLTDMPTGQSLPRPMWDHVPTLDAR